MSIDYCSNWFEIINMTADKSKFCNDTNYKYRINRVPRLNCDNEVYETKDIFLEFGGSSAILDIDFTAPTKITIHSWEEYVDFIVNVHIQDYSRNNIAISINWF